MVVGTLLNVRGLMEVMLLNIGLAAGLLRPDLYALLLATAVITMVMAPPMLRLVRHLVWAPSPEFRSS
jgi:Kef-type K+ transport system membrane component KefB